jgi:hypothetical protein
VLLQLWLRNKKARCRYCARRLRLPDEHGSCGSLLIDGIKRSTVCIHGHGALTSDYWNTHWRTYGAFWDEMAKPSRL